MKPCSAVQRLSLPLAWVAALWASPLATAQQFAHLAPADTGLYVEITQGTELLLTLTQPERWAAIAEFAGQPATDRDAASWRNRVEATIGIGPEEAIQTLFARGVAFLGAGPFRSQDPVLLCRPSLSTPLPTLLNTWEAQAFDDPELASLFRLRNDLGLAIYGDTLMLGSPALASGAFRHALHVQQCGPENSLAAAPEFQRLLQRIPPDPAGIFFIRPRAERRDLTSGSLPPIAAALAVFLPAQLREAEAWLIGLHRKGNHLKFTAVGHQDNLVEKEPSLSKTVKLPEQTLAAWQGNLSFEELLPQMNLLPDQHIFRLALPTQTADLANDIFTGSASVAFSTLTAEEDEGPARPTIALILEARDAPTALAFLDGASTMAKIAFDTYADRRGLVPLPPIHHVGEDVDVTRSINVSDLFAARVIAQLGEVHLCWGVSQDHLVLATHPDWLDQVLEKLNSQGETEPTPAMTSIMCRGEELASIGRAWLTRLEKSDPELLTEAWWRRHQPGNRRPRLGITVSSLDQGKSLRIDAVESGQPAEGFLRPGDVIVGCHGKRFEGRARREVARGLVNRPNARWIDLSVQRDNEIFEIRVPMPFVNPARLLKQAVALGETIGDISYSEELEASGKTRGILTVAWHQNEPASATAQAVQEAP